MAVLVFLYGMRQNAHVTTTNRACFAAVRPRTARKAEEFPRRHSRIIAANNTEVLASTPDRQGVLTVKNMKMYGLSCSVGEGGDNFPHDVSAVKSGLQRHGFFLPDPDHDSCDIFLIQAIRQFQSDFMHEPTGLIEPDSGIWDYLVSGFSGFKLPFMTYTPTGKRRARTTGRRPAQTAGAEQTPSDADDIDADSIHVVRKWETAQSTISELSFGNVKGYVLERPGPDTTASGLRFRIPVGAYKIHWHNSGLQGVAPFNPVPELFNDAVPKSRHILIHNGNYPKNTDGCLLVGSTKGTDMVGDSRTMLRKLKAFIQEKGIENVNVIISAGYQ
ncbi:MAG: DUF5675 family protein [Azoarcus sp.]|jgi:hypothetical protein|nr:DUF5675 family protein [Azoarcus sp.]